MPQIGWFELLIVVLVAILIIGPKDFPVVLRKLGSWIGSTKKYFSEILYFEFLKNIFLLNLSNYLVFLTLPENLLDR